TVRVAGSGVQAGRAAGAVATANDVAANDKEFVGVEGFARPDAIIPPARFRVIGPVVAGGVGTTAQGVNNQNGVRAGLVQVTIGFIGQGDRAKAGSTFQLKRFIFSK